MTAQTTGALSLSNEGPPPYRTSTYCTAVIINTTSKLGLPSHPLLRTNTARRETPGRRNTKAPQQEDKATNTRRNRHDHNRTLRDPALTWGGNRRDPRPCATRLPPGAGRRGRARSELTSRFAWCTSPHFQRTSFPYLRHAFHSEAD